MLVCLNHTQREMVYLCGIDVRILVKLLLSCLVRADLVRTVIVISIRPKILGLESIIAVLENVLNEFLL